MNSEELESQLSAMFDGELPQSECELLSRRIDREEALRARWSRYALIGAAMRSEPVATARSGFAKRVSDALEGGETRVVRSSRRGRGLFWNAALAASMVAGVAGLSINMLRNSNLGGSVAGVASEARKSAVVTSPTLAAAVATPASRTVSLPTDSNREPLSYVTPTGPAAGDTLLQTQLADYIVAHSEYSTALMRRNLLSTLVSSESAANGPAANVVAPLRVVAGHADATPATSYSHR